VGFTTASQKTRLGVLVKAVAVHDDCGGEEEEEEEEGLAEDEASEEAEEAVIDERKERDETVRHGSRKCGQQDVSSPGTPMITTCTRVVRHC
jgi:hypothetical protein